MRTFAILPAARSFLTAIATLIPGAASVSSAEEMVIRSGPDRVSLLELYSSEGCSSCPSAEQWLGGLRKDPRLWRSIVPVAFHVDYWDNLGWKDRFAKQQFTARQRAYAAAWGGRGSVYTPGFVVDGREWRGWFERGSIPVKAERAGTLEARASGGGIAIRFEPEGKLAGGSAYAAWLGLGLTSDVRRGENSGRTLRHDFVALSHGNARLSESSDRAGGWNARIDLPRPEQNAGALAVWVESSGLPLQAAGGWTSKPPE